MQLLGCTSTRLEIGASARLVFWGFDKVFLAEVREESFGALHLEQSRLPLSPPLRDLNGVSGAGSRLALVGRRQDNTAWNIFVVDAASGRAESEVPYDGRGIGLAPGGQRVAFLAPAPKPTARLDLVVRDLATSSLRVVVPGPVGFPLSLSWHSSGESIAYDGVDGWIYSVRVADGQTTRLVEGTTPAWAPDGRRLTFRRDQTVYLYELATGMVTALHTRRARQSQLGVGFPSWSPDERFVTWNGEIAYDRECILIEVATGKAHSIYEGPYRCGPWVESSPSMHRVRS